MYGILLLETARDELSWDRDSAVVASVSSVVGVVRDGCLVVDALAVRDGA